MADAEMAHVEMAHVEMAHVEMAHVESHGPVDPYQSNPSRAEAMFTIYGKKERFCDGVSRRGFLKIGAMAAGGMAAGGITLPGLLRAESAAGAKATGKSIINIYLPGGPTHMDTFDLKPDAPKEYRGEF